jgi:hypothetical protein
MTSPFGTSAIVVNTVRRGPGQMTGLGDFNVTGALDAITGGAVSQTQADLATLKTMLQVTIGVSIVSGVLAISALLSGGRR